MNNEKKAETFKIFVAKEHICANSQILRALVTPETLAEVTKISEKCHLSKQQIAGRMIEYAIKNLEYVEV